MVVPDRSLPLLCEGLEHRSEPLSRQQPGDGLARPIARFGRRKNSAAADRQGTAAMVDGKNITAEIARYAAALRYDDLPPPLVELVKQIVLDTLGVSAGASGLALEARILADYVREAGGRPDST